ncbi:MAG: hypothetical protein HKO59_05770, partial [Phycisphaerales bacterium]|nr:hypothetical protein [Phycisphaerales bacterium]NNM25480.1 hypothetical protein [Phycisphaerales bacterium]
AAGWCKAWAITKIVFVVANSSVGYLVNRAQFEAMMDDPGMASMGSGFFSAIGIVGVVFGLLWGWALPVFLLIWFGRPKVKQEMATWAGGGVPALPAEPATWPPEPPVAS